MNRKSLIALFAAVAALAAPVIVQAQTSVSEDFTGATTSNSWYYFNGACLTASTLAGSEPASSSAGQIPGCSTIAASYYNKSTGEVLVGGFNGTFPDPVGSGALRFTNGYPYGFSENGGVVFATPFNSGQGVAITFKTVTYRGNSGGGGSDGADGLSFFLMDATKLNTAAITGVASGNGNGLGSWGGSLAYTCSNANGPYNGLIGGYIGLGIDEYGNFLNGTNNTLSETGTTASGDNTASGGGYQPGRIGLRGAGNIAWLTLNGAYGTNPNSSTLPYYPASLSTSCAIGGGTYNSAAASCLSCSTGTYNSSGGNCLSCAVGTLSGTSCIDICAVAGYTYNAGLGKCTKNFSPNLTPTTQAATTGGANSSLTDNYYAVQNTCTNGTLYNYSTASNPTSAGATTLTNAANPGLASANIAPILDYAALPGGYTVLPWATFNASISGKVMSVSSVSYGTLSVGQPVSGASVPAGTVISSFGSGSGGTGTYNLNNSASISSEAMTNGIQIANESAATRGAAAPIFYQLKITENGLLSLSYSYNGGAYQSVIKDANITTANGSMPANFLFGFAGSTGGSSNIHEILCFKAAQATSASASAGASEKQASKLETGAQAYFAYYNPSNGWTGTVTASGLGFDSYGNVMIAATPNWDASCVLTGVIAASTCTTTLAAGPIAAEAPTSRVMLTWNGSSGVPFEWSNLANNQQTALNAGDTSGSPALSSLTCPKADPVTGAAAGAGYAVRDRLDFLRGDRACEINSLSVGLFRKRTSVLADIIDSSPTWVGAPDESYTSTWADRLYPTAVPPENATTAQTYPQYVAADQQRLNVVYVGSNDGLLHGFRSGYFSSPNNFVSTFNDGEEVLAYMPGAVVQSIHSTTPTVDYSNAQYGHNFFVDATPGTGDVFFNGSWHTWLVGGLGAGGAAIYALDVSNPTPVNFAESNAASIVLGEWTPATITCVNVTNCGNNLGNTYGTPVIRRLHDGKWALIFGNGLGSATGDAGIFVATLNPNTGAPTFYYYSTNTASTTNPNGISFASPVDLDGDHITDYVYAGDLQGNVWRFDLTSNSESSWKLTPGPLFKTPAGQPITTAVVAASGTINAGGTQYLMILFGTGQKIPLTNSAPQSYATATQSLYGVWDWNMTAWNTIAPSAQYAALAAAATGLSTTNDYLTVANLQAQTVTVNTTTLDRDIATNANICWAGQTGCTAGAAQFGWYLSLPGSQEQIIYNPELVAQALTVNSIVPAPNNPTSCANPADTGFTYLLSAMTGGSFDDQVFLPPSEAANPAVNTNPAYLDQYAIGMQTNATGGSFITSNNAGTAFLVFETNSAGGGSGVVGANLPPNTTGRRLGWIERR